MDTKETKSVDKGEVQKNVVRFALVIFFVATVSAAGGLLQGERMALTNGEVQTAQAVPAVAGGDNKTSTLSPSGPKSGTENLGTSTEAFKCDGEGGGLGCTNKCSTSYVLISANGKDRQTLDCSPREAGEGATGRYPGNEKLFDEGIRILAACKGVSLKQELEAQCLGGQAAPASNPGLSQAATDGEAPLSDQQIASVLLAAADGSKTCSNGKTLAVFEKEVRDEVAKRFAAASRGSATTADANRCNYRGAVVCYKTGASTAERATLVDADDNNAAGEKWECVPKKESGANPPGTTPPANQCIGKTGIQRGLCDLNNRFEQLRKDLTGALSGNRQGPFGEQRPPGGDRSDTDADGNQKRCPAGYKQSTEQGRIICTKNDEDKVKPQCILAASKENIKAGEETTIRWRTANAQTVKISGISGVIANNGEKKVKPTDTTTYTLTATSKDKTTQTCTAIVTVEEEGQVGTPTGSRPPQISCNPTLIPNDKQGVVRWACPAIASSSKGEGFDTEGKLSGEATVAPNYNTEYSVACVGKDGEEIGKNACSINVGEPKYDILVYPATAKRGDRVRVSWASLFMKSCRVQGPRGFDYERAQGVVITEPFALGAEQVPNQSSTAAVYTIECESKFGGRMSKDVAVQFQE
ncbi:hypothetical protein CL652_00480 [bacterium]|nr:hypothetical protein [bacterium]|tara:strand:- start:10986 stop:12908 length:1923 start_codon:yes stop_codon:yes gene_type:complete